MVPNLNFGSLTPSALYHVTFHGIIFYLLFLFIDKRAYIGTVSSCLNCDWVIKIMIIRDVSLIPSNGASAALSGNPCTWLGFHGLPSQRGCPIFCTEVNMSPYSSTSYTSGTRHYFSRKTKQIKHITEAYFVPVFSYFLKYYTPIKTFISGFPTGTVLHPQCSFSTAPKVQILVSVFLISIGVLPLLLSLALLIPYCCT